MFIELGSLNQFGQATYVKENVNLVIFLIKPNNT